jgi:predicted alpha-1,2-mannosidase
MIPGGPVLQRSTWAGVRAGARAGTEHGTGSQDFGVLGFLPLPALDTSKLNANLYSPTYKPANEVAEPGYYSITLDDGIQAEFTATTHASLERYTFPKASATGTILIDLAHHLSSNNVTSADLTLNPAQNQIVGNLHTTGGMSGGFPLFFVIQFNKSWTQQQTWANNGPVTAQTNAAGTSAGTALTFDVSDGSPIEAQVALSLVSSAGAQANLAAELTTWNFAEVQAAAVAAWNKRLNSVTVYATPEMNSQLRTFYSALHHAFVMPGVYSDVDGSYNYESTIQKSSSFQFMNDVSGWDIYRSLAPLYSLIAPDLALNMVASLHTMGTISSNFPKWPLAANDAGSMIGSAADVIVSEAYLNGVTGFDVADSYKRLRDAALIPDCSAANTPDGCGLPMGEGRGGRNDDFAAYSQYSYVVAGSGNSSVSHTCEYNQDDFALANLATALGAKDDAQTLMARSHGYQHLYDPSTGFLRGHNADGTIQTNDNFDPKNFGLSAEYVESDAWQTMFCPQWDAAGLAQTWGGNAKLVAGLEQLFENTKTEREADVAAAKSAPPDEDPDEFSLNLPPVYYFGGNEPDIHYAYLFAQAGRPDLTQKWIPWVMQNYFSAEVNGLPGNDDGGTMAAWYVLSAIGLYPVPGSDQWIIGTPQFPRADLQVQGGVFSVVANNVSAANIYVQSARLNGKAINTAMLHHSDLKAGGSLVLEMGSKPSTWAVSQG